MLAALIVVAALCLSLMIISIHSTLNKKPQIVSNEQNIDNVTRSAPVEPQIVVEPKPPENNMKPAERTQPRRQDQTQPQKQQPQKQQPQITQSVPEPQSAPAQAPSNIPAPHSVPPETRSAPPENRTVPARSPTERTPPAGNTNSSRPAAPDVPAPAATTAVQKPVENLGTIVFIIDDAGNNLIELDPFFSIPGPLTMAVLPGLPHSAEAARRIRAAGKEVILHQPMEAIGGQNPGPGAIYSNMNEDEIRAVLKKNIDEVGPVKGINNHQGSKITMNSEIMQIVLTFCKENNIFYIDSRTTADTVVPAVARKVGIKIAERNVFIDNEQNKDAMLRYISGGLSRMQKNSHVVMIGHTWSPALAPILKEQYPLLIKQGYTIKTASDIVR